MSEYRPKRTKLEELAQLIEQDLVRRGLKPGDRYLTAHEVGELFDAHPRQANRAMNLLAERDLLARKAAVGTVVGPAAAKFASTDANGIHVFIGADRLQSGLRTDVLLQALATEIPGSEIKFTIISDSVTLADVNGILDRDNDNHAILGMVLLGCDRHIQEAVAKRRLPAVVFGSVFPSTTRLSSIDLDQRQLGYLLAENLLAKDCQRLALVMHQVWLPGDNAYLDGIHAAIAASGKPLPPPTIRACAMDPEILAAEISDLLAQPEPPQGIICRSASIAEVALKVAPNLKIAYDAPDPSVALSGAACLVKPAVSFRDQTRAMAKLLRKLSKDPGTPATHQVMPVEVG